MTGLNLTQVPEVFTEVLGIPLIASGILISMIIILVVVVFLALLDCPMMGIAGSIVGLIAFFTFIGWFPIWVSIGIALIIAILFGTRVRNTITGSGGGDI